MAIINGETVITVRTSLKPKMHKAAKEEAAKLDLTMAEFAEEAILEKLPDSVQKKKTDIANRKKPRFVDTEECVPEDLNPNL